MMWDKGFYVAATTFVVYFIAILVDSNVGFDGNLGIVAALITTTIFNIYYNMKDRNNK